MERTPAVRCTACGRALPPRAGSMLFGDELWPGESVQVQFDIVHRGRRRGRLSGLGDFRALRQEAP